VYCVVTTVLTLSVLLVWRYLVRTESKSINDPLSIEDATEKHEEEMALHSVTIRRPLEGGRLRAMARCSLALSGNTQRQTVFNSINGWIIG
jgi:hypothetical protein